MKFHPGMKDRDEISSQNEKKEKKTCKQFIPGWNFKMSMFFLIFDVLFKYVFQIQHVWTEWKYEYNET